MTATSAESLPEGIKEPAGEIGELSTLLEVSQALSPTIQLRSGLECVLAILGRHHGAVRGAVVLRNELTGNIEIEAAIPQVAMERPVWNGVGEGTTGKVIQTGQPIIVPLVSEAPAFLHRAAARPELPDEELTYVSVPIERDGGTNGALAIDLWFKPDRDYQRTVKCLGVVGSMIAQAVKVHELLPATLQTAGASGTVPNRSLREVTEAVEKDALAGCAEERSRQPGQGRRPPAHDWANLQQQSAKAWHRLALLPFLTFTVRWYIEIVQACTVASLPPILL